jgi:site-specific DNA-methyltransferase (cytosine-N4-specific)
LLDDGEATAPLAKAPSLADGYKTRLGTMYPVMVEALLDSAEGRKLEGKINLIFTSPPFPLNRKKQYGNFRGQEYLDWLEGLAPRLVKLLAPDGSIVVELGNAWEPGKPVMSTLALEALLAIRRAANLNLCQQFVCHNPARLPSPAQWVNIERIRVKDAYTHVWWMSPNERPKANNKHVLRPYGPDMLKLLKRQSYNAGLRPSGHDISPTAFLQNNQGAIPSNVLTFSNTRSSDPYRIYCRKQGLKPHPAPMAPGLASFFVKLLTIEGDLVFDPFAGSNTTGAMAEELDRHWYACEPDRGYVEGSRGRFPELTGQLEL